MYTVYLVGSGVAVVGIRWNCCHYLCVSLLLTLCLFAVCIVFLTLRKLCGVQWGFCFSSVFQFLFFILAIVASHSAWHFDFYLNKHGALFRASMEKNVYWTTIRSFLKCISIFINGYGVVQFQRIKPSNGNRNSLYCYGFMFVLCMLMRRYFFFFNRLFLSNFGKFFIRLVLNALYFHLLKKIFMYNENRVILTAINSKDLLKLIKFGSTFQFFRFQNEMSVWIHEIYVYMYWMYTFEMLPNFNPNGVNSKNYTPLPNNQHYLLENWIKHPFSIQKISGFNRIIHIGINNRQSHHTTQQRTKDELTKKGKFTA